MPDPELEAIVDQMIDAGESDEDIGVVVEEYGRRKNRSSSFANQVVGDQYKGPDTFWGGVMSSLNPFSGGEALKASAKSLGGYARGATVDIPESIAGMVSNTAGFASDVLSDPFGYASKVGGALTDPGTVRGMAQGARNVGSSIMQAGSNPEEFGRTVGQITGQPLVTAGVAPHVPAAIRAAGKPVEFAGKIMSEHAPVSGMIPRVMEPRIARTIEKAVGGQVQKAGRKMQSFGADIPPEIPPVLSYEENLKALQSRIGPTPPPKPGPTSGAGGSPKKPTSGASGGGTTTSPPKPTSNTPKPPVTPAASSEFAEQVLSEDPSALRTRLSTATTNPLADPATGEVMYPLNKDRRFPNRKRIVDPRFRSEKFADEVISEPEISGRDFEAVPEMESAFDKSRRLMREDTKRMQAEREARQADPLEQARQQAANDEWNRTNQNLNIYEGKFRASNEPNARILADDELTPQQKAVRDSYNEIQKESQEYGSWFSQQEELLPEGEYFKPPEDVARARALRMEDLRQKHEANIQAYKETQTPDVIDTTGGVVSTGDPAVDDILSKFKTGGADIQVVDEIGPNASGESAASAEALSRGKGMRARGETYVVYDQAGNKRPLIGPDAVDFVPGRGETYGIEKADGTFIKLEDRGGKVTATRQITPKRREYPGFKGIK